MRKIISFLLAVCFTITMAKADNVTKVISSLNVNKNAISVSVKDVESGNVVYSLNERTPRIPASTLKIITSSAAYNILGDDYEFSTKLYKSTNNDLYLKLGADPFLTSSDLSKLIDTAKSKKIISPKNIYVDSSIFDNVEWGEGWQWDDDLNPLMPKFSAYNLDGNLLRIDVTPTNNNSPASIATKPFYPLTFMNLTTTTLSAKGNNISLSRNNNIAPNVITVEGTVSKTETRRIPVNDTKRYFTMRLEDAIRDKKIDYYNSIKFAKLPTGNIYEVDEITHKISPAMTAILKNSNNLVAETLFKVAGAVFAGYQGSSEVSLAMVNRYLDNMNLDRTDIRIVDGSGVSKNNLMTTDFMTEFLVQRTKLSNFEEFKAYLPTPGEGTLKDRMLYFRDNLNAKTGTLSEASAIAGYLKTRKGKMYAFDIMINDAKTSNADKKNIEEQILRQIYTTY